MLCSAAKLTSGLLFHWSWGVAVFWTHFLVVGAVYGGGSATFVVSQEGLSLTFGWLVAVTLILFPSFEWAVRGRNRRRASGIYFAGGIAIAVAAGLFPIFSLFLLSHVFLPFFTLPFVVVIFAIREDTTGFYAERGRTASKIAQSLRCT